MKNYKFRAYYEDGDIIDSIIHYETLSEVRYAATQHVKYNGPIKIEILYKDSVYETLNYKKVEQKEVKKMKTKEMPIVEVSRELKRELDRLDIISDTHNFYTKTGNNGLDVELQKIASKHSDFFTYQSQVLMYLASTKNYVEEEKPKYNVLYGLISKKYYVWFNKNIPFDANVFIRAFDNKKDAEAHADELNKFVEGK